MVTKEVFYIKSGTIIQAVDVLTFLQAWGTVYPLVPAEQIDNDYILDITRHDDYTTFG